MSLYTYIDMCAYVYLSTLDTKGVVSRITLVGELHACKGLVAKIKGADIRLQPKLII